jgi:predicted ATPase
VPVVEAIDDLDLPAPFTPLSGDNGSGKSTPIEAIADAVGFASQGGEPERSGELPARFRDRYWTARCAAAVVHETAQRGGSGPTLSSASS